MRVCVSDWRGERHRVKLSEHNVSILKYDADLTVD